jgi:alpha-tubulin suppressor-like RCC1 family protein
MWGTNTAGRLGNGSTANTSSPGTVSGGGSTWASVYVGSQNTAAVKTDGTLWVWGYNNAGQLGNSSTVDTSSPTQVAGGGTTWRQASTSAQSTAAIRTDGTLWTWGTNTYGQLGTGTTSNYSSPVAVPGGDTNWSQIAVGASMMAAVKTDGTLWTWGRGVFGQLGNSSTANTSSPATVSGGGTNWSQVACCQAGGYYIAAIKTDNTLWVWGYGNVGKLGTGSTTDYSSPVQLSGSTWSQVSLGANHTAAIKTDGTLWTWGYNLHGELGNGTTVNTSTPGSVAGGGTTWLQVSVGSSSAAAIKTDGTLWVWGYNISGDVGDGTTGNRSSPVTAAGGGTAWSQVSGGNAAIQHV